MIRIAVQKPVGKDRVRARTELLRATPTTHGAKLLVAATAMRAYRNWHLSTLRRCCEAWERVGHCATFECTNFHAFGQLVACLTRGNMAEREDAIYNLPWSRIEKEKALAECRRSQRAWCAKKKS